MKSPPERPYKDLNEFRKRTCLYSTHKLQDIDFFPCPECNGRGSDHDPADRDPVEGYKMAPLYPCRHCDGGAVPRRDFVMLYNKIMRKYFAELRQFKLDQATVKKAMKKLSKKELDLIQEFLCRRN